MVRGKRDGRRKYDGAAPFGAFGLAIAIATACGGKSVVVSDDSSAGDETGGHGGSATGGKGGTAAKGGKGGTGMGATGGDSVGATGGDSVGGTGGDSVGGTGGGGGSGPVKGGGGGRGGSAGRMAVGGSSGVGGRSPGGRGGSAGFSGFSGFAGFANSGGVPIAGFGGFAGAPLAGFAGRGMVCDACNDNDVCTDDLCTPIGTCLWALNSGSCDDGDACTADDHCSIGSCLPGTPVSCDDNQECTIDACDSDDGCSHTPAGEAADETDRNIPESDLDCSPAPTSAVSVVTLPDQGNVVWVTAELVLAHTWGGDVTVQLEHAGVSVKLLDRFPGDGSQAADFNGTYTFAATGRMFEKLDTDVTIPSDTYASLESLAPFAGLAAAGDWTLTVSDGCHGDRGTLWGFRLHVGSSCTDAASMCAGACDANACICTP